MVKFEMEYVDASMIEVALYEFINRHKQEIHRLQTLPERSNEEKDLIKMYENRVRNAGRALRVVGRSLNDAEDEGVKND
jgi:hypothetical protein